jgi:hypothetical protein
VTFGGVISSRSFEEMYRIYLKGYEWIHRIVNPEYEEGAFLRNVGAKQLLNYYFF